MHCLILDDNGYIIVSDNPQETGFFFGKIRSDIMQQLVDEGIYKVTTMYDYQGLCTIYLDTFNPASKLFSVRSEKLYVFQLFCNVLQNRFPFSQLFILESY